MTDHVHCALRELLTGLQYAYDILTTPDSMPDAARTRARLMREAVVEAKKQVEALGPPPADPDPAAGTERTARDLVWDFASRFEYMTALQASARLDAVMDLVEDRLRPLPSPNDVLRVLAGDQPLDQKVTRVFALFAGESPLSAEPEPPLVASLRDMPQDSAPMLQLRRDVKCLEDRGCRGQTSVSRFTLAEMVGLNDTEFDHLSLETKQKFENRAYTALRVLNGGVR